MSSWHYLKPCYLPEYSPDLNPIEGIWRVLKDRFLTNWMAKTSGQLIERICLAIRSFASIEHLTVH
ncbi:MAG: transposase [Bdellovibrionales bacterium]|nr:transposase [Bdellovibrionales bacterium]